MSAPNHPGVTGPYVPSPASITTQLLDRLAAEVAEVRALAERARRDTTQLRDDVDALAAHARRSADQRSGEIDMAQYLRVEP